MILQSFADSTVDVELNLAMGGSGLAGPRFGRGHFLRYERSRVANLEFLRAKK
jgi:hypothetical protein